LATLLNAANVHRSTYHSLGLSLRLVCPQSAATCTQPHLEFTQHLTVVFDPHMDHKDPDQTRPLSWSLRSLFGIGLVSACPLADTSKIYVDTTQNLFSLQPTQGGLPVTKNGRTVQVFDVPTLLDLGVTNVIANYHKPTVFGIVRSPVLHASRYLVGHGQEKGGIITKLVNKHSKPVRIILMETVPWYLRLFLHTLNVSTEAGQKITPLKQHFVPGRDRDRPYVLELVLELPARSVTKVSIEFEKSLLRWLEYPPDANHGFYVSAATITAFLPSATNVTSVGRFCSTYDEYFGAEKEADLVVQLFTETLLVNLPTPDFSMPYNVICLACTVVALAFGPLHNITTKTLVLEEGEQKKSVVARTIAFIKQKLPFKKRTDESHMTEEERETKKSQ
jgi:phosphatidylinositol glycan class T